MDIGNDHHKRDKQTLCIPNERFHPLSKSSPVNLKPVSDEASSPLYRKHRENILSDITGMQSAYFILQKIPQDQKQNYSNKQIAKADKKEVEGKPTD